jgi:hypothetical protein
VIYLGIDDTDIIGSPGTNQLARAIVRRLGPVARGAIVCRHQLFFDPRVPFTSGNGSASIQLPDGDGIPRADLLDAVRAEIGAFFVEGSDPGLAIAVHRSAEIEAFAARAKTEVVSQSDARAVAEGSRCYLEGLGGTNQGIIGALAAIALAAGGNDGRVVHLDGWPWPDPLCGEQSVAAIMARGVQAIRPVSGGPFTDGVVNIGKHLRPNWRGAQVVMFVEPSEEQTGWRAKKFD